MIKRKEIILIDNSNLENMMYKIHREKNNNLGAEFFYRVLESIFQTICDKCTIINGFLIAIIQLLNLLLVAKKYFEYLGHYV